MIATMNFKRFFSGLAAAVILSCSVISPMRAYADDEDENKPKWSSQTAVMTQFWSGREWIRSGGENRLDGIQAENREETEELENYIQSIGYVLVNTPDKKISDAELDILRTMMFKGSDHLDPSKSYEWSHSIYKVYIYKPLLEQAIEEFENDGMVDYKTNTEIGMSTVFLDYQLWESVERVGTTVDAIEEINDNLPEYCVEHSGYVQFTTPVDCSVKLHLQDQNFYYELFLRKGTTLMRLRAEHYAVVEINTTEINEYGGDELMYNGNYIVVYENPEDNPVIVDFSQVVARDGIESIDLTGKPDYGYVFEPADINDLGDVTVEKTTQKADEETSGDSKHSLVFLIVIVGAVIGVGIYAWKKKER